MTRFTTPRFIREPAETYHAQRERYLTSHQLIDFQACPRAYKVAKYGLMDSRWRRDSEALLIGRATHVRILEGSDRFAVEYFVGDGPVNPTTGKPYGSDTKKFREWSKTISRPVLTFEQAGLVEWMNSSVQVHGLASELLSEGTPEGVLRCTYNGIDCQVRLDWFSAIDGLVDLKTCNDIDDFESDAERFGYVPQMAFYQQIIAAFTGEFVPVHLIVVEKQEPHRCGVWQIDEADLRYARDRNVYAIDELLKCQADNYWPTRYEHKRILRVA